jgi:hypothetical protein
VSGTKSFNFYSLVNCKFVNQLQGDKIGRIFEVWANFNEPLATTKRNPLYLGYFLSRKVLFKI